MPKSWSWPITLDSVMPSSSHTPKVLLCFYSFDYILGIHIFRHTWSSRFLQHEQNFLNYLTVINSASTFHTTNLVFYLYLFLFIYFLFIYFFIYFFVFFVFLLPWRYGRVRIRETWIRLSLYVHLCSFQIKLVVQCTTCQRIIYNLTIKRSRQYHTAWIAMVMWFTRRK